MAKGHYGIDDFYAAIRTQIGLKDSGAKFEDLGLDLNYRTVTSLQSIVQFCADSSIDKGVAPKLTIGQPECFKLLDYAVAPTESGAVGIGKLDVKATDISGQSVGIFYTNLLFSPDGYCESLLDVVKGEPPQNRPYDPKKLDRAYLFCTTNGFVYTYIEPANQGFKSLRIHDIRKEIDPDTLEAGILADIRTVGRGRKRRRDSSKQLDNVHMAFLQDIASYIKLLSSTYGPYRRGSRHPSA